MMSRLSPKRVGSNSQWPRILGADKSTRSQLLARSACCRYIVTISSRALMAVSSFSSRFFAHRLNFSTSMSSPHSLTSCHCDRSSSGTSSRGVSRSVSLTIWRVWGTFSPRNSSPSPYWPGPVLKKPISTCRCRSLRCDSIYPMISLAVIIGCKSIVDAKITLFAEYSRNVENFLFWSVAVMSKRVVPL